MKRILTVAVLSLMAAVIAAFGVTTASASPSESASLDCDATYADGRVWVECYYNGTVRGTAAFNAGSEPEWLTVWDHAQDGKGVTGYIRRTSDGKVLASLRNTSGNPVAKPVSIAEGTYYTIRVCLDGAICGERYPGRA